MRLNSLQLVNFRNYNNLYLEFNKKVNLLLGKNGQGKTNIVESIYMLSFGKSFRTSRDKEIIKFDTENLYVGGSFSKEHTDGLIEIAIGKNKKGIKVNKIHIQKITISFLFVNKIKMPFTQTENSGGFAAGWRKTGKGNNAQLPSKT